MFLGIIAVLSNPAYGTRNFNALGYACTNLTDIKVYDAEAWCQSDPELPEKKNSQDCQAGGQRGTEEF